MTPDQQIEMRIRNLLCAGCNNGYPLDARGYHVHQYVQHNVFKKGDDWQSKSWFKCTANPDLLLAIVNVIHEIHAGQIALESQERKKQQKDCTHPVIAKSKVCICLQCRAIVPEDEL
jgi:hypothetical protein